MSLIDARDIPADQISAERLSAQELDYRLIDTASDADTEGFLRADARGFLDEEPAEERIAWERTGISDRRNIGVFEADAAAGVWPIATVNSWVTPLSVPGGELGMWAISSVTVASTHRRRGIARALLEGELRAAASAGVPIAGLTASEATIYGRYGFASAVPVARMKVDTRRAGWAGPTPTGRIEYIDRETLKTQLSEVHERARSQRAGQIAGWEGRWERMAGLAPGHKSAAVRGVRHLDADGTVTGVLAYRLSEGHSGFRFVLQVQQLVAVTPDALAALWRFALQHDLVDEVTADLRPLDDPLPWLVADPRGVTQEVHDHGWLRVLDVPSALQARRYSAPIDVVIRVVDSLEFAAGDWRLRVDADGVATVDRVDGVDVDAAMDVSALSAIYPGSVRAVSLRGAGRITTDAATAERLDRTFAAFPAPTLDIWY